MLNVVIDSREQLPYCFEKFQDVVIHRGALAEGDYSLLGCEHSISIERKELGDLVNCLSHDRDRFTKELNRLRPYPFRCVIVEASLTDIARHRYRSNMLPQAALQSVFALMVRFNIPFLFTDNRGGGEYAVYSLLAKYARELQKQADAVTKVSAKAA